MTDKQTPADWILLEAAKRCNYASNLGPSYWAQYGQSNRAFRALCDMIEKHEQPPVDRKLLCAERAIWECPPTTDEISQEWIGIRAIELWEEGFGK